MSVALTGNDVVIVNDRSIIDLGDGDAVNLDFPNNLVEGKKGKNGNVLIAFNASGDMVTATFRILKGSADDKFFNSELRSYINDKSGYILMTGEFVKSVGDGAGNVTKEIYTMSAGFVQKIPNSKENTEGDTEQSLSIYQVIFMNNDRSLT